MRRIGVIGAGQMGSGIAHVCSAAGLEVRLVDLSDAVLAAGHERIEHSLGRQVARGKLAEADMAAAEATFAAMIEDFGKLESEADFPAFLAPYQAKFDACEDMRKLLQAG